MRLYKHRVIPSCDGVELIIYTYFTLKFMLNDPVILFIINDYICFPGYLFSLKNVNDILLMFSFNVLRYFLKKIFQFGKKTNDWLKVNLK